MIHKTRGIALNFIRYRETSIIAKIYTEEFGIQSYIVNGVRSAKSKTNRIALFQPLTLLDLVVYHKSKEQTIHRLSEIKCSLPFKSLPFDFVKSSIALFITELLVKTLREEETNNPLFEFLSESITYLEETTTGYENFHLQFLAKFAFFLGFGPETVKEIEEQLAENLYPYTLEPEMREAVQMFIHLPYEARGHLDRLQRSKLLDALIFFYKVHLEGLGEIKSLDVLRELMR
ncbi:DNA repair protein RecO [Runella sp. SP2]|uniref:DNA repair protein RecO n=1 Tax=Runella sp. SP2 TaxID=2268026 RepID=UPI000F086C95|nr:DNA repair protein RecO [Runella sp. SP2]AYQ35798.1 DNA repair protein RecO [Runella sp. SP2]